MTGSAATACHLFGILAASPLSMPWHHLVFGPDAPSTDVLPDSLDQIVDDDLQQFRDRGAIATSNAGDWRDEEPIDTWHRCDTEPQP